MQLLIYSYRQITFLNERLTAEYQKSFQSSLDYYVSQNKVISRILKNCVRFD